MCVLCVCIFKFMHNKDILDVNLSSLEELCLKYERVYLKVLKTCTGIHTSRNNRQYFHGSLWLSNIILVFSSLFYSSGFEVVKFTPCSPVNDFL